MFYVCFRKDISADLYDGKYLRLSEAVTTDCSYFLMHLYEKSIFNGIQSN